MILVTGGSGFLGKYVVGELRSAGEEVRVLDLVKPLEAVIPGVEYVQADVLDTERLREAFSGITEVIHCASFISWKRKDYNKLLKINVEGTSNVVNQALKSGVDRFLHVSCIDAFGYSPGRREVTESMKVRKRQKYSGYGLSKYLSELEVYRGRAEGLNTLIVNFGNLIGGTDPGGGLNTFAWLMNDGFTYTMPGSTAYINVIDAAGILREMIGLECEHEEYIAVAGNIQLSDWQELIAERLGVRLKGNPSLWARKFGTPRNLPANIRAAGIAEGPEWYKQMAGLQSYSNDRLRQEVKRTFRDLHQSVDELKLAEL